MLADLHSHSYYSDGINSPREVIKLAKDAKCDLFALTDHDTTDGIFEIQKYAQELELNLINGVEISAMWNNMTIHIVGLNIDITNLELQELLKHNQFLRKERAEKIIKSLSAAGMPNVLLNTQKLVKKQMITRTHFARMMINEGICSNKASVFKNYLTSKKPGGVRVPWKDMDYIVNVIKNSGGRSVIAHPLKYKMTNTKVKRMLNDFKSYGGDAVEVLNGNSTINNIEIMLKMSKEVNLAQSSGSDFHGDSNFIQIGKFKKVNLPNPIWMYL